MSRASISLPDHYEIQTEIGRRPSCRTLRALDRRTGGAVVVRAACRADWMTDAEAQAARAAALDTLDYLAGATHPGLPPVLEFGTCGETVFAARAWVDGISLRDVLARRSHLETAEVAAVLEQVSGALDALAVLGLEHGGLTPDNVFICADGRLRLTDAGWARMRGLFSLQGAGRTLRDLGGVRHDVQRLAALAYTLLTGLQADQDLEPLPRLYHLPPAARDTLHLALIGRPIRRAGDLASAFALVGHAQLLRLAWRPAAALGLFATLTTIGPNAVSEDAAMRPTPHRGAAAIQRVYEAPLPALTSDERDGLALAIRRHGLSALGHAAVADRFALKAEQRARVRTCLIEQSAQIEALVNRAAGGELVDTGIAMQELRDATNARVLRILTDAQRERWESLVGAAPAHGQPML